MSGPTPRDVRAMFDEGYDAPEIARSLGLETADVVACLCNLIGLPLDYEQLGARGPGNPGR